MLFIYVYIHVNNAGAIYVNNELMLINYIMTLFQRVGRYIGHHSGNLFQTTKSDSCSWKVPKIFAEYYRDADLMTVPTYDLRIFCSVSLGKFLEYGGNIKSGIPWIFPKYLPAVEINFFKI